MLIISEEITFILTFHISTKILIICECYFRIVEKLKLTVHLTSFVKILLRIFWKITICACETYERLDIDNKEEKKEFDGGENIAKKANYFYKKENKKEDSKIEINLKRIRTLRRSIR